MTTTPFVDSLMLENFDIFKALIADIKTLKTTLSNENRRTNKPICASMAYDLIKKVADPIQRVFNGRKIKDVKAIELFTVAIRKVNLLARELGDYGREKLAEILANFEQRLVSLLPINTVVQLELFEPEPLDTGNKKPSTFSCFDRWKREALIQEHRRIRDAICRSADAYEQNKLNRLNTIGHSLARSVEIVQNSIKLR